MPRIPKPLDCSCHFPVNASEDIKLQVMEEILRKEIPGIIKIEKTSSVGLVDVWTIYLTNGQTQTFTITNGEPGEAGPSGPQGPIGPKGDPGKDFSIAKTYGSVEEMLADFDYRAEGDFVLISSTPDDPNNSKLFVRTALEFKFLTDMSGAQGIKGEKGDKGDRGDRGQDGAQGERGDRGEPGEPGPQGPQGIQGLQGPKGKDGLTTKIRVGESVFEQNLGTIILPEDLFNVKIGSAFTTNITVGHLESGTPIEADETLGELIKTILYKEAPIEVLKAYHFEGKILPTSITDEWAEELLLPAILDTGISHNYTGGYKGYIGVAYNKTLGELKHVYQNNMTEWDLLQDMTKYEVVYKNVAYYMYLFTEKAVIGPDRFDYLFK